MLQSQKTEGLHLQSEIGRSAEAHMAELEERLDNAEKSLANERAAAAQAKEEHSSTVKSLEVEIARLRDSLMRVIRALTHSIASHFNSILEVTSMQVCFHPLYTSGDWTVWKRDGTSDRVEEQTGSMRREETRAQAGNVYLTISGIKSS